MTENQWYFEWLSCYIYCSIMRIV